MRNTTDEAFRLAMILTDLLAEQDVPDRLLSMEAIVQTYVSSDLIPGPEVVRMDPDEPMAFALDLIADNATLREKLGLLERSRVDHAMRASDPVQLAQTIA